MAGVVLHRQEGGRQKGGGEGHFEFPKVPSPAPRCQHHSPVTTLSHLQVPV